MKILVIGGAGFIGSHYVNHVLSNGDEAVVLDNFSNSSGTPLLELLSKERLEVVSGDIRNSALISSLVKNSDLVVNFAAWTHNDTALTEPGKFVENNVIGTMTLLEAVRQYSKRLHQVSTDEVYGDLPINSPREFHENSPVNPSNPYSSSKAASDHLVKAWYRSFGVKATISVTCNNFGPYQNLEKFVPRQISRLLEGESIEIYGDGKNIREWMPVQLNVACIDAIARSEFIGETFNIGSGQRLSNLHLAQILLKIANKENSSISFINDRPGHDLKYAISSKKFKKYFPNIATDFCMQDELLNTFTWYKNNPRSWI